MRHEGLRAGQVHAGTTFTAAGTLFLLKATPIRWTGSFRSVFCDMPANTDLRNGLFGSSSLVTFPISHLALENDHQADIAHDHVRPRFEESSTRRSRSMVWKQA